MEQWKRVKAALGGLDWDPVFNEAVAVQYHQAKQQQIAEKLEVQQLQNQVQQLQNQVQENVETWETTSATYVLFEFSQVCTGWGEKVCFKTWNGIYYYRQGW